MNKIIYILIFLMAFQGGSAQSRKVKKILRTANYEMSSLRYAYAIPLYKSYLMKGGSDTTAYKNLASLDLDLLSPLNGVNYTRVIRSTEWITSVDNFLALWKHRSGCN